MKKSARKIAAPEKEVGDDRMWRYKSDRKRPKNRNKQRRRRSVRFETGTKGNSSDEEKDHQQGIVNVKDGGDFMSIKIFPHQEYDDFGTQSRSGDEQSPTVLQSSEPLSF